MNDIGKELYERVRADFERRLAAEKHPSKDMRGVSDYSARVGRYLAEAIAANVTEDALPDGRLYYNIAESILTPTLRTNYELVNDTAAEVQRLLDERQGLRIKPARADYPEERVHAVIGAASEEGIPFDKALRRMTSPAENITQSFADDFMQANAEQRSKAGFDTFIERQGGFNCCPWCAGLVGVFAYPKGLPKEVFARHDNCTCSVTYGTKGGARQNAWTKAKWNVPPIEEPHRMTAEEAAEKGGFDKPKRLTGGNLAQRIISNRGLTNQSTNAIIGLRAKIGGEDYIHEHEEPVLIKTINPNDIAEIRKEIKAYEAQAIEMDIETACVITKHGDVYYCFGWEEGVYPDYDLGEKIIGAYVSHNHPIEETQYSFSEDDVRLYQNQRLALLRGCDKKFTYEINGDSSERDEPPIDWDKQENVQHTSIIILAETENLGYRRWKND